MPAACIPAACVPSAWVPVERSAARTPRAQIWLPGTWIRGLMRPAAQTVRFQPLRLAVVLEPPLMFAEHTDQTTKHLRGHDIPSKGRPNDRSVLHPLSLHGYGNLPGDFGYALTGPETPASLGDPCERWLCVGCEPTMCREHSQAVRRKI